MASTKTPVLTDKAPKPLPGIYSQAIKANGMVFVSGAVAMDPETMQLVPGDVQAHTVSAFLPVVKSCSASRYDQALTMSFLAAPMHQEPDQYPRSRRIAYQQGGQG